MSGWLHIDDWYTGFDFIYHYDRGVQFFYPFTHEDHAGVIENRRLNASLKHLSLSEILSMYYELCCENKKTPVDAAGLDTFNYIWQRNVDKPEKPFYMVYLSCAEEIKIVVGWSYDKDAAFNKALALDLKNIKAIVWYQTDVSTNAAEKWLVENGKLVKFD